MTDLEMQVHLAALKAIEKNIEGVIYRHPNDAEDIEDLYEAVLDCHGHHVGFGTDHYVALALINIKQQQQLIGQQQQIQKLEQRLKDAGI